MQSSPAIKVVEHIRKTVLRREDDRLSDGQLLDRFLEKRDEGAFAALVRRHGPMVWGVCHRIVGHTDDAEDAFQAAFIILVRKAAAVKPREAVGNWLYGVACHTALKARTISSKVRAREKQVKSMPELAKDRRDDREEMHALLDQELSALPDKYRLPVVLCELEGRTRKEVAAQLKIPEGTLSSRLATAHQMLAKLLARHGLAVSGGSLAALFAQNAASASVPAAVISATIKTATLVAASKGAVGAVVSTKVAALAEGALKAMFISKLKVVVGILLALGVFAAGVGTLTHTTLAARQPETDAVAQLNGEEPGADDQETLPGGKADKPKTDHDRLHGTWEFVSYTQGGKTVKKADLGNKDGQPATLTFVDDKTLSEVSNIGGKVVEYKGIYKIDPSRKPKEIELIRELGEKSFAASSGIYEIEGDTLRLCWPADPKDLERPTKLESKNGESYHLMTYKRVPTKFPGKEGDKPKADANNTPDYVKLRATLEGHGNAVYAVVFSPNGKFLASASDDFSIKIWDTATNKEIKTLTGHQDAVASLAFSADGRSLASTSMSFRGGDKKEPGAVKLWDVATWEEKVKLKDNEGAFRRVAFSPDGKVVAAVHAGAVEGVSVAKVWDTRTGKQLAILKEEDRRIIHALAFSPDAKTLILGSKARPGDDPIRLWNWAEQKANGSLKIDGTCIDVRFTSDGKTLVTLNQHGDLTFWDFENSRERHTLKVTKDAGAFALSTDEKMVALQYSESAGGAARGRVYTGRVELRDTAKGGLLEALALDTVVQGMAFSSKGMLAAGGLKNAKMDFDQTAVWLQGEGGVLRIWEFRGPAKQQKERVLRLDGPVTSALWSPDGKLMAVVATRQEKAKDGDKERPFDFFTTVRIHDAATGKENVSLGELKNANHVHRMFAPDGKTLAISTRSTIQAGDKVELWDTEKGELVRTIEMEYGRAPPRLAFSPDGSQLAVAYGGGAGKVSGGARIFDTKTGDQIHGFTGHKSLVYSVCFSPDGKTLATGGDYLDREIYLWNLLATQGSRLVEPRVIEGLKGSAWCVAFSPDGKTLAGSDTEGGVRLWDVATGKEKAALPDNASYCSSVAFSGDGRLLLGVGRVEKAGKQSGEVRVWDVKTEKLLMKLENSTDSAAFSPDDHTLSVLVRGEGIKMINLAALQTDPPKKDQPKDQKPEDLAAHIRKLGRLPSELTNARKSDAEIVNALFRASLNRAPGDSERAAMTKHLDGAKDRTQNSRDILFLLVHSHEFLKLHNLDGNIPAALRLINELSADWDKKTDEKKPGQKK